MLDNFYKLKILRFGKAHLIAKRVLYLMRITSQINQINKIKFLFNYLTVGSKMSPVLPVSIVAFPKRGQGFLKASPLQSVVCPYFKCDSEGEANV